MKKIMSFLALMAIAAGTNAQITLEHTYNEPVVSFLTNTKGIMYYNVDRTTKRIKFYNANHSHYKTVDIEKDITESDDVYLSVFYPSEKLFNSDSKLEFIVMLERDAGDGFCKLYDEDGTVLMDFVDFTNANIIELELASSNGVYKLLVRRYGDYLKEARPTVGSTKIYSLPGSLPSGNNVNMAKVNNEQFVYPNPAKEYINIPYQLGGGESATLGIYSESGGLVEEKRIDNTFNNIRLDVSRYKAGVYIYRYNGGNGRFIVR